MNKIKIKISGILNWFVRESTDFEANITTLEGLRDLIENKQEDEWINENKRPPKDWPSKGKIEFVDYSAKYRNDLDYAIKDLSFQINPGEKVGICGRTGSGKSTITFALFRMIEHTHGSILIDDIDISEIGLHDLRQRITIIPQVSHL